MRKLFPHGVKLICLLAALVSGCSSAPSKPQVKLIQADKIKVAPLETWIREPVLKPISIPEWQQLLSGSETSETAQSSDSTPASKSTTP